jgi:hypothetical protein
MGESMPKILKRYVEGQSIKMRLNTGKDLSAAITKRIYYKIPDGNGGFTSSYWDATIFNGTYLEKQIDNVVAGNYSAFPHAEYPDGSFISRSADPAQWRVWKEQEL